MKSKKDDPGRKWVIEVNERQLYIIINCVQDIHRFAAGQMELNFVTHMIIPPNNRWKMQERLNKLQPLMTPGIPPGTFYPWDGGDCPEKPQREFIAETYAIYRNLLHCIAKFLDWGEYNVYQSETLTCGYPLAVCRPQPGED